MRSFRRTRKLEKVFRPRAVGCREGVARRAGRHGLFSATSPSRTSSLKEKGVIEAGHIWKLDRTRKKATIFRSPSGNVERAESFDAEEQPASPPKAPTSEAAASTRTAHENRQSYIISIAGNFCSTTLGRETGRSVYFSDPHLLSHGVPRPESASQHSRAQRADRCGDQRTSATRWKRNCWSQNACTKNPTPARGKLRRRTE